MKLTWSTHPSTTPNTPPMYVGANEKKAVISTIIEDGYMGLWKVVTPFGTLNMIGDLVYVQSFVEELIVKTESTTSKPAFNFELMEPVTVKQ